MYIITNVSANWHDSLHLDILIYSHQSGYKTIGEDPLKGAHYSFNLMFLHMFNTQGLINFGFSNTELTKHFGCHLVTRQLSQQKTIRTLP